LNEFLSEGKNGGVKAAQTLVSKATAKFAHQYPTAKIWVTVFANVDGLASTVSRQGWNTSAADVRQFVKGFNDASDLVSFVDVDLGKEKADNKIRGTSPSNTD
jgi:hypothetical protein